MTQPQQNQPNAPQGPNFASDDMLTEKPLWDGLFDMRPSLDDVERLMAELKQMISEHEDDEAYDTSEAEAELEQCQNIIDHGAYADCQMI
jgi:hypothetical protein